MKQPGVIIQEMQHGGRVSRSPQEPADGCREPDDGSASFENPGGTIRLSDADINEILKALHCRRTPRSSTVLDKLTKAWAGQSVQ